MLSLYRPFNDLFRDDFFNRWEEAMGTGLTKSGAFTPAVDVIETDGAYMVKAELAGVKPEEIDVSVKENVLTLKGERKEEHEETKEGYRRMERSYGSFMRSFTLPQGTDTSRIEANSENGVLTLTIPKVVEAEAKKVEVKSGGLFNKAKKVIAEGIKAPQPTA